MAASTDRRKQTKGDPTPDESIAIGERKPSHRITDDVEADGMNDLGGWNDNPYHPSESFDYSPPEMPDIELVDDFAPTPAVEGEDDDQLNLLDPLTRAVTAEAEDFDLRTYDDLIIREDEPGTPPGDPTWTFRSPQPAPPLSPALPAGGSGEAAAGRLAGTAPPEDGSRRNAPRNELILGNASATETAGEVPREEQSQPDQPDQPRDFEPAVASPRSASPERSERANEPSEPEAVASALAADQLPGVLAKPDDGHTSTTVNRPGGPSHGPSTRTTGFNDHQIASVPSNTSTHRFEPHREDGHVTGHGAISEPHSGRAETPSPASDIADQPVEIKEEDPRFDPLEQTAKAIVEFAVQGLKGLTEPGAQDAKVAWFKAVENAEPDELVKATRSLIHDHGLGQPTYFVVEGTVGSEQGAKFVAGFIECYELPVDSTLLHLRRGVQILGAITAIINGQPVLAIASLKSLFADEATRLAKGLIVEMITVPFQREVAEATVAKREPTIEELVAIAKAFGWTHLVPGCAW